MRLSTELINHSWRVISHCKIRTSRVVVDFWRRKVVNWWMSFCCCWSKRSFGVKNSRDCAHVRREKNKMIPQMIAIKLGKYTKQIRRSVRYLENEKVVFIKVPRNKG